MYVFLVRKSGVKYPKMDDIRKKPAEEINENITVLLKNFW